MQHRHLSLLANLFRARVRIIVLESRHKDSQRCGCESTRHELGISDSNGCVLFGPRAYRPFRLGDSFHVIPFFLRAEGAKGDAKSGGSMFEELASLLELHTNPLPAHVAIPGK